jgi:3-oxoacyl-[acyl-carrier-protein] synthase-3
MIRQALTRPIGVRFAGTGVAVPQRQVTNDEIAQLVDTSDEWVSQRTGIKTRRLADDDVTVRDLAREASIAALDDAQIAPSEVDLLILATMTPEMPCPATAARLVDEIGATPAGAMDISVACSGFVYAMNLAESLIQTGAYRTVAVVGAETLSRITDWNDRRTCILFGDGAGAAILTASDDPEQGCVHQTMRSDGSRWQELYVPQRERDVPAEAGRFSGKLNTLQLNGREVYKFAVSTTVQMIEQTLDTTGFSPDDIAMVIPHQSNKRILESVRDKMGLPDEKMCMNIDKYGNTSAASVPIGLREMLDTGRIQPGDLVLFLAIGGGMTWSSSLWRM